MLDAIHIGDFSVFLLKAFFSELFTIGFGFRFLSGHWGNQIQSFFLPPKS
jgi:hypothetical protein